MIQFKDKITILVLDFNKPEESEICLQSIQNSCLFEREVIFYSNGGEQNYAIDFYKRGLIDKLVLSKRNWGLGIGTTDLIQLCRTEYFIYLQQDQYFFRNLEVSDINLFVDCLKIHPEFGCISLAGSPCGENIYSDRCHFGNINLFRKMDLWDGGMPDGGCGPFWSGEKTYNENFIQRYFAAHNLISARASLFVCDNGKVSIRENQGGSRFRHSTDEKRLWVEVKPDKIEPWPDGLTKEEWGEIIRGDWPKEGKIPENWKKDSFIVKHWH